MRILSWSFFLLDLVLRLERTSDGDDEGEDEGEEKLEAVNIDLFAVGCDGIELCVLFGSMLESLCVMGVFSLQGVGICTSAAVCGMLS